MGYFLGFALLVAGYTLLDWGHYYAQHRPASMWWLVSGQGTAPPAKPNASSSAAPSTNGNKGPFGLPKPFGLTPVLPASQATGQQVFSV